LLRIVLLTLLILTLAVGAACQPSERSLAVRPQLDLTGEWRFAPDAGEASIREVTKPLQNIKVPGAWQAQGYGTPGGKMRMGNEMIDAAYLLHNLTAR